MDFTPASNSQAETPIPPRGDPTDFAIASIWQGAVTSRSGFAAVPMSLLRLQGTLGISATDLIVLINLLAHRWRLEDAVFPRTSIVARRMGVDPRTVQRSIERLIKAGLMERETTRTGLRAYRFDKLNRLLAKDIESSLTIERDKSLDA